MKRIHLWMRLLGLGCIVAILIVYQKIAETRASVVADNKAKIAQVEEYNKEIEKKMAAEKAAAEGKAQDQEKGLFKDGNYEGEGKGYGGNIRVRVIIENEKISEVKVLSHDGEDPAYYSLAEKLLEDVIEKQTAEVDTVSGATFSSKGIIAAVGNALEGAKQDGNR